MALQTMTHGLLSIARLSRRLSKAFRVIEGHRLAFRAEMFNVTNSPRFAFPTRTVMSTAFGRITSTYNPLNFVGASRADDTSRVMQVALKFEF